MQDSGKQAIEETLSEYLSDKELLLILDNFEQVAGASRTVSDLVACCKGLKVLVTSRTSLHVRHERIYHLATLGLPGDGERATPEELRRWPATQLFVERALEVNPRLQLDRDNGDTGPGQSVGGMAAAITPTSRKQWKRTSSVSDPSAARPR